MGVVKLRCKRNLKFIICQWLSDLSLKTTEGDTMLSTLNKILSRKKRDKEIVARINAIGGDLYERV